jgi:nucleoside-diphosphate-sugar epimerase
MRVTLTGGAGFIGSHIVTELTENGHDVTALVRSDADADAVSARGATPKLIDLYDRAAVVQAIHGADGAIHTASPGDETSADLDAAVADAAIEAFAGTGKPYIHISGLWIYGNNDAIDEDSAFDSPGLVAWRLEIEQKVLDASTIRGVVIVSSVVYGDGGGGLPGLLLGSPRDPAGNLIMPGPGEQRWPTVHAADLANAFRLVLEKEGTRGRLVVGNGLNETVMELTGAAAAAVGAPGAVAGSEEEIRARVGDYFAEVLLLDQATNAARIRAQLGWQPRRPSLVDEFRTGSYTGIGAAG